MKRAPKKKPEAKHSDELTLRLEGALVTPEDLRKAVQFFTELLIQVTEETARGVEKPLWNMTVREGSLVFVARPIPSRTTEKTAKETIRNLRGGIARLGKGEIEIPAFNQKALIATRDLAGLQARQNKIGIQAIQIANGDGRIQSLTPTIAEHLKRNLGEYRTAYGSIEGRLQTISDRGTYQFVVFDSLTQKGVNCFVPEARFPDAHAAFGKRVGVTGEMKYDKSGKILSIRVSEIKIRRDLSDIPEISHFRGMLKAK